MTPNNRKVMCKGGILSREIKKFRVNDEEWEIIKSKAAAAGMKPCTYVRRMAVEGQVKKFDMKIVNDVRLEMSRIGTNINQIAAMVNTTNSAYAQDVESMKKEFIVLRNVVDKWLLPFD